MLSFNVSPCWISKWLQYEIYIVSIYLGAMLLFTKFRRLNVFLGAKYLMLIIWRCIFSYTVPLCWNSKQLGVMLLLSRFWCLSICLQRARNVMAKICFVHFVTMCLYDGVQNRCRLKSRFSNSFEFNVAIDSLLESGCVFKIMESNGNNLPSIFYFTMPQDKFTNVILQFNQLSEIVL